MEELTHSTACAGFGSSFASQASAVAQLAALSGGVKVPSVRACRQAGALLKQGVSRPWEACKARGWRPTAALLAGKGAR